MKKTREQRLEEKRIKEETRLLEEKKTSEKFMKCAIKQARIAESKDEVPIGAVIVKDGKVLARAHNQRQTKRLATAHAEIIAIERACKKLGDWRLNGCDMYVTLEPCAMCAGAIANARISRLYFGAYERKGGACGSVHNILENSGLNSNTEVHGGVLEDSCSLLIKKFFENKRNKIDNLG